MTLLRDSSQAADFQMRYEQIWDNLQQVDEKQADRILTHMEYELLPRRHKIRYYLQPFKTHWLWIVPACVLLSLTLMYALFLWVALLVE